MSDLLPQHVREIEAILLYSAEPVWYEDLAKILNLSVEETRQAVSETAEVLASHGMSIVTTAETVVLATAADLGPLIERMVRAERERDLGRAGIETLTIVAYKGPISRKEIEYIRGVNSQFAIRNLLLRGLIEKKTDERGRAVIVYTITSDALLHLGLRDVSELPDYAAVRKELEAAEATEEKEENPDGE